VFDFELADELALLAHTARSFAEEQLAPKVRSAEAARQLDDETRAAYASIGLAGLELPVGLCGAGFGPLARALVNEALGAADPGAALALDRIGPAFYPLLELGGEHGIREFLMPLLERDGARAVLVAPGDAQLEISGDALSGELAWAPVPCADLLVVLLADGALVVRDGIACEAVKGSGLRAAGGSRITLRRANIAARFQGDVAAQRALARARLYVAALLVGVLRQAAEYSRNYAIERVAFGKPIAHHQALAFLITDMHMAVEGARLLVHDAAFRAERGLPCEAESASAFVEAVEASRLVGPAAVQILGGHGFMQDHPVEKYMRESRALGLLVGGVDAAREQAGARLSASVPPLELSAIGDT
jgi:alkylation response protein AidB-like acyl-CoA dehydrogenase